MILEGSHFLGEGLGPTEGLRLESPISDRFEHFFHCDFKVVSPVNRRTWQQTQEIGGGTWVANVLGNEVIVAMFIG